MTKLAFGNALIAILIYALATYRITRLVVRDAIFASWRDIVRDRGYRTRTGTALNGDVTTQITVKNRFFSWLHDLITCEWCTSIWSAALVVLMANYQPSWWHYVCYGLALSSVNGMLGDKT